jgi:kynureninase
VPPHSVELRMPTDDLLRWRDEFPILASSVYLVSHSLGAMPRRARESLAEYTDTWATRGVRAWGEGWWEMPRTVGDLIGRIIGAEPGTVVMHQNQSIAQATILSALDWPAHRREIVTERLNFPSNLYLFHALGDAGARITTVESDDGQTVPLDAMLAAIDEHTRLVSVSHVVFKSGFVQDIEAITRRAHEVGALVLVDLYQSAGTVPVDVGALGVDFATGGSVKWLCGGPGAGYLYVRRDHWPTFEPRLTGWMAHRAPFAFEDEPITYADDAFRFLNGTPNVPGLYAARSGYDIIVQVGVPAIRAKSVRQTQRIIELADAANIGVAAPRDPSQRGGTITLQVPDGPRVTRVLAERDVLVDYRPGAGIRVSPHFYTKDEELELFFDELLGASASTDNATRGGTTSLY